MKLLVTGSCGFIGSNSIHYMLRKYQEYQIINLDKSTYTGNPVNLKDLEDNPIYSFVKGDICDSEIVNEVMKTSNQIINFVAKSNVNSSINDGSDFVRTNIISTKPLLRSALVNKIKKIIHQSDCIWKSDGGGSH